MNNSQLEAMKAAAELGATHYQKWETFHAGGWVLVSLSFTCPSAPCEVAGSRIEVAAWTAAAEKLLAERRPTIYWRGHNLARANKEHMYVSAPLPIPVELMPPAPPTPPRVFSSLERGVMLEAAAMGATHYQLLEHYHDYAWHLGSISFTGDDDPQLDGESNPRRKVVAEWSAEMNRLVKCDHLAYRVEGHNADKADKDTTALSTAVPMPVDQLRAEAMRQHVLEFVELELTKKLEAQISKALDSGGMDMSAWDGVNLNLPRALTTAILREAADRVIWERSHGKQAARTINNIRAAL